jgi:PAS domain S-box-containing protein
MSTLSPEDAAAILAGAGDGVIVAKSDGLIAYWNAGAERIFGHTAEAAVGQSLDLIIPERLQQRHWTGWDKVMGGEPSRYGAADMLAVPSVRADGEQISVEFTITVLHEPDGSISAIAAILRDVTARFQETRTLRARIR